MLQVLENRLVTLRAAISADQIDTDEFNRLDVREVARVYLGRQTEARVAQLVSLYRFSN